MMPIVILAGGLGTRLGPTAKTIPKSMVTVAGFPFIEHQLRLLSEKGAKEIILCVGHLGNQIEGYVEDGSDWGLHVQYSYDGDQSLGTGGAIKKLEHLLPDKFMVLYGDSYLDIDYELFECMFLSKLYEALMTVFWNQNRFGASNVRLNGYGRVERYEKKVQVSGMDHIDYGLTIFKKRVFDEYPIETPFDLSVILSHLASSGKLYAVEEKERFYEIGTPESLEETERYINKRSKP